ncbi:Origin recognition complex subunit Orc2 [Schizosaccharomyces pombe]
MLINEHVRERYRFLRVSLTRVAHLVFANSHESNDLKMVENVSSTPKKGVLEDPSTLTPEVVTPRTPGHRIIKAKGAYTKDRSAKRRRGRIEIERHLLGEFDDNVGSNSLLDVPLYSLEAEPLSPSVMLEDESMEGINQSPQGISVEKLGKEDNRSRSSTPASPSLESHEFSESREAGLSQSNGFEARSHGTGFDEYFDKFSQRKTSSNTLSQLPVLDNQVYLDTVKEICTETEQHTQTLVHFQSRNFHQWYFELVNNFNLLFYGFGSKEHFLSSFVEKKLPCFPIFVVKGYFPQLQLKNVLSSFLEFLEVTPAASVSDMLIQSLSIINSPSFSLGKIVFLVHNIDGESLIDERFQSALAAIASSKNVYFIASVDHVNFALLWDTSLESSFNFVMHDATTFARYYNETTYENSLGIGRANVSNKEKAIKHVLYSLPANSRGIFKFLLIHQLERMMDTQDFDARQGEKVGIEYRSFFQNCSAEFLCSNEPNFRSQLTEFFDHNIIESKRDVSNSEILWVPYPKNLLEILLEDMMEDV